MSRVLVTGGCGFIGANLLPLLAEHADGLRVLDDLSRGRAELLPPDVGAELVVGDVRDPEAVEGALRGIDVVVHLAAAGSVADSVADPASNFEVNVRGTFTMLERAVAAGVGKFVFASTGGALIGDASPPVDERSLPRPISPYGASKLCGEAYCHAFAGSFALDTIALRFANVYGPVSAHKQGAVTKFITAALHDEPLVIYGDGRASRDFLYVGDLCQGIAAAVRTPLEDPVLHLASEHETTIDELARLILELTGKPDLPVVHRPRRTGEVQRNFARSERAAQALGFAPTSSLRDGMRRTIAWFQEAARAAATA